MKHEIKFLHGRDPLVGEADSFKEFVEINKANLHGANLRGAYLDGAYLRGAYLHGANLRGADLDGANLSGANLSDANLSDAYLRGAYLSGANLGGANLSGANLSDANLSDANLGGADLSDALGIAPFMSPTSGRICYVVDHGDVTMIQLGCFWGTINKAEATIREKHPNDAAEIYIAAMRSAEAVMKYRSKK
jgi:uncharacterized protein YjbI with pentapeptide repeats